MAVLWLCAASMRGQTVPDVERSIQQIDAGQADSVRFYLDRALAHALQKGDSDQWLSHLETVGRAYQQHDLENALDFHIAYLEKAREQWGERDTVVARLNARVGNLYRKPQIARFYTSLEYMEQALDIYAEHSISHAFVGFIYLFAGNTCTRIGSYEKAQAYLQRAIDIWRISGKRLMIAHAYSDLGIVHADLQAYDQAVDCYDQALILTRSRLSTSSSRLHGMTQLNRADVLLRMHRAAEAKPHLDTALQLFELIEYLRGTAGVFKSLGDLSRQLGDKTEAVDYYQRALIAQQQVYGTHHREVAKVYVDLAAVHLDGGAYEPALHTCERALRSLLSLDVGDSASIALEPDMLYPEPWLMIALEQQANIYLQRYDATKHQGDLYHAYECIGWAEKVLELLRDTYTYASDKRWLFARYDGVLTTGLRIAAEMNRITDDPAYIERALVYMEKGKSHAFLEHFQGIEARQKSGLPDSLAKRERELAATIEVLHQHIREGKRGGEASQEWSDPLWEAQSAFAQLKERLREFYPAYFQLKYDDQEPSIADIRRWLLDTSTALLEYTLTDSQLFCLLVTQDTFHLFVRSIGPTFHSSLHRLLNDIRYFDPLAPFELGFQSFAEDAYGLYHELLAPPLEFLAESGDQASSLIVIADRVLGYLPMEVLIKKAPTKNSDYQALEYIIRDHSLSYAYSASTLIHQHASRQGGKPSGRLLAFAPSFAGNTGLAALGHAQKEAMAISDLLGGVCYMAQEASKQRLLSEVNGYQMVHFATHATVNTRQPLFSQLYLSSATGTDTLSAYELFSQPLNIEMAVLSACNTGAGQYIHGDGIASFGKGFAYAGCPSVVMSLWPVNDQATAQLMAQFYQSIGNGHTKDQSMREAKLAYLRQADQLRSHPFFWAGFVVQGNRQAIEWDRSDDYWVWAVIGLVLLLGLVVWKRLRAGRH